MTNRSDDGDPDWWSLIDREAAMREQFPPIAKVRHERPGCAADIERQRLYREATELAKARDREARWRAAVAANARRREQAKRRKRNAAYKARRQDRDERRAA